MAKSDAERQREYRARKRERERPIKEANTRLAGAAFDMLEALEWASQALADCGHHAIPVDAAIAKAKGYGSFNFKPDASQLPV